MQGVGQDLVYGLRRLRRSPGFTLGAIAVLALGVGVNLAEFQIFNALLFQRISVRDMDSLRGFSRHSKTINSPGFPYAAISFYREYNTVFSAVLAESSFGAVSLADDPDDPRPNFVSGNYFRDLGLPLLTAASSMNRMRSRERPRS
jgi:hypothetical protein